MDARDGNRRALWRLDPRPGAPAVLLVVVASLLLLSSCAAGPNPAADVGTDRAGFLLGFWHGVIVPVTFVISLFTDNVNMYEANNVGNWYDAGFFIGLTCSLGGGGAGAGRRG